MKRNLDLTVGSPMKVLPLFALPMIASVIFQQLYNIADNVIAGQFLGDDALAAVSISYPVAMSYMAIALGINGGASVVISQLFGGGQWNRMKTAVSTAMIATGATAVICTGLGMALMRWILRLMQTPQTIFADTYRYLIIYTAGLVFIFLYNTCTAVFTAMGDSLTPLLFLIASSVGNVLLDIAFVAWLHMGVAGCAWATLICQALAAVAAWWVLQGKIRKMEGTREKRFSVAMFRSISRLALPGVLQQSSVSVGNLIMQGLVNSYALSAIIGGYGAAIKLNTFYINIIATFSNVISCYTAQNIGAGKPERISRGCRWALLLSCALTVPASIFFWFFGDAAMRVFVQASSVETIRIGWEFLRTLAPFYLVVTVKIVLDGVLKGAGAMFQFTVDTFADLLLRVALSYLLPIWFGYAGIWMAFPIGWFIGTGLAVAFYCSGKWKRVSIWKDDLR